MKKIIYIILAGALLMTGACQKQGTIYEIPEGNACVSFPSESAKFTMVAEDGNKITVEMWRGNTKGAASIAVDIEDGTDGVFTPSKQTFDFADGEGVARIDFTYPDINDFGGEIFEIVLSISDPKQVSPAGIDKMTIKAQRKLTLKYLGTGIYYSEFFSDPDFRDGEWEQDIYTTEEAPNMYILPNCWKEGTDFTFTMVDGKPVWPSRFYTGFDHDTYGAMDIVAGDSYIQDGELVLEVKGYVVAAGSFGPGAEYFVIPDGVTLQ